MDTRTLERAAAALWAGLAALLPVLVAQHVISAAVGQDIGVGVAAVAAAWHGGIFAGARLPATPTAAAGAAPSHTLPGPMPAAVRNDTVPPAGTP